MAAQTPGLTKITGVTGQPIISGSNQSIARYFDIHPTVNTNLDATHSFNYNEHEVNGLPESELVFFRSANDQSNWQTKGYTVRDTVANTVVLENINSFSIWTLGSEATPLPVHLLWYTAKRHQQHALQEWKTASEKNKAGFEIEVSKNGKDFIYLGKVEVTSINNYLGNTYSYLDNSKGIFE